MADGSINFDTSIDTQGVSKVSEVLKGRFRQLGKELQKAFGVNNNKGVMQKLQDDVKKATDAYDAQIKKIEQLKKELNSLEAQRSANAGSVFSPSQNLQDLMAQSSNLRGSMNAKKASIKALTAQYNGMSVEQRFGTGGNALLNQLEKEKAELAEITAEYNKINAKADALSQKEEAIFEKQKANADAQLSNKISATGSKIEAESSKLDGLKLKAEQANAKVKEVMDAKRPTLFGKAVGSLSGTFKQVTHRIAGLAKRVLIFSVITKALNAIKKAFTSLAGSDEQISSSLARIKGNLLTAFQPLWEAIQPALVKILALIESATAKLAQFTSAVFGKTTSQMSANAKALNAQTEATEEAEKSLAGFDTIEKLGSDSSSSDSSSSADFSGTSDLDELDAKTKTIMAYGSMILGVACLLVGIALVNIPLIIIGIGMIASGIAIGGNSGVFDSVPQWVHNIIGWGTMLAGVAMIIVGFATGPNIPLIIMGFAMLGVGITYSVKTGVFNSTLTALKEVWAKVKEFCVTGWNILHTWWTENITPIWEKLKYAVVEVWRAIKDGVNGNVDGMKTHLTNAFNAIKSVVTSVWNGIKNVTKSVINWLLSGVEKLINGIINGINFLINKLNALCARMPDWVKEHTVIGSFNVQPLGTVSLPRLASGTVVPANNGEFGAILGDNRHETEVVSPLSTMKQALIEALNESGGMGINNITLTIANKTISEATIDYINGRSKQLGVSVIKAV